MRILEGEETEEMNIWNNNDDNDLDSQINIRH